MQIAEYMKNISQRVMPYLTEKKPDITTRRCCVSISNNQISLVHLDKVDQTSKLLFVETMQYEDINTLPLVLSGMVQRHKLFNTPTYLLLPPDDYQLFMIDALPVKQDELRDAVSWRVRSLIAYPVEEAVIDFFMLPAKKSAQSSPMVAAITAKLAQVSDLVTIVKKSGFLLTTIDIPELAMRNLTSLHENDEKSTAFIAFYENSAILNITCQKRLYFTRRINLPENHGTALKDYEELSLELLRYFDYFQSQWRYPTPSRVFITTDNNTTAAVARLLTQHLLLTVEPFSLSGFPTDNEKKNYIESHCLLTLGCALRKEDKDVTPRN